MPAPLVLAPLVLAVVLLVAGVAKVRRPHDLVVAARSLRLPEAMAGPGLLRAVPVAEILLGLGLLVTTGSLFAVCAILATGLMLAYLVVIARAARFEEHATCACFGDSDAPVDSWTVARNALLVLAGAASIGLALGAGSSVPEILWGAAGATRGWLVGAALVAVFVYTAVPHRAPAAEAGAAAGMPEDGGSAEPADTDFDYVRVPIAPVAVETPAGQWRRLLDLAKDRPLLLIFLSSHCLACVEADPRVPGWRDLLPEVRLEAVFTARPKEPTFPHTREGGFVDPTAAFSTSVGRPHTPSAVLLGSDGLLAGGPVVGVAAIEEFVRDIRAELDGRSGPA